MPTLEPHHDLTVARRPDRTLDRLGRATGRGLSALEHQTVMRMAAVQSQGMVDAEKLHEVDRLAQTAMSGQALLAKWRETLAGPDPMLNDELKFFSDVARMGKAEIVLDSISAMRRK